MWQNLRWEINAKFKEKIHRHVSSFQVIILGFMLVILLGSLCLTLPLATRDGQGASFLDALFTSTSAVCVTGLVLHDTASYWSMFGQAVILFLIQIGGMGVVTVSVAVAIFSGRKISLMQRSTMRESISAPQVGGIVRMTEFILKTVFLVELLGAVAMAPVFVRDFGFLKGVWYAMFHSISAFCNAGFDILGRVMPGGSVIPYQSNPYVLAVISLLIISGGLGFLVWQDLSAYHRTHHLRTHTKLVLWITGWLLLLGTAGILFMEYNNPLTLGPMNLFDKITNAALQSVSARTAGYNSIPLGDMTNFTKIFMSLLMFIGAAPGGTGGGIKVTTLSVVLLAVASVVRGRDEAMIFGRRIDHKTVYKSLTILMLSLFAVIAASMTLFYNTGPELNEVNSVFEAVSAFGTVGLSVGVTPLMNPFARVVTMLTMFIGRVGPVSLAISLSARKDSAAARRAVQPQAHINVG